MLMSNARKRTRRYLLWRTYYVRDAQGNIMATYNQLVDRKTAGPITLRDHSIYGSSRLGVHTPTTAAALAQGYYARAVGDKQYELTDHLGNVRSVVSDVKLPAAGGGYKATLASYYNYYAFGMLKPRPGYERHEDRRGVGTATASTARRRIITANSA